MRTMQDSAKRGGLLVGAGKQHIALSGLVELARQIVKWSEEAPVGVGNARDSAKDFWSPLKTPPLERHGRGLQHPIRLQPVNYVVMTRRRDERVIVFANPLLRCVRADLCDLPVND